MHLVLLCYNETQNITNVFNFSCFIEHLNRCPIIYILPNELVVMNLSIDLINTFYVKLNFSYQSLAKDHLLKLVLSIYHLSTAQGQLQTAY